MNRTTKIAISGGLALSALALCADSGFAQVISAGNGSVGRNSNNSGVQTGGAGNSIGNINNNENTNLLRQTQRQTQANRQSISGTGNSNIMENSPTPVPNVFAPGLAAAGSEVCLGSVSAGGSGSGFGLTIGGTFVDRECQLRLNARTLATLGYPVAARETMCLDEDVRRAMYAAGTPCAADRGGYGYGAGAQPSTQVATAPASPPSPASHPVAVSEPVVASQPDSASDSNCMPQYQLLGGWFYPCGEKVSEKVSEPIPTPTPTSNPVKKHTVTARAKPAAQSKDAKATQPAHETAATPTTAPTQVAAAGR